MSQFIVEHAVDSATRDAALDAVLDTVACMLAGSTEDGVTQVESLLPNSTDCSNPRGFKPKTHYQPEDAAMVYGTAAHILDYDDVSMLAMCHPSAPVLAALLAARPWATITGTELCDALAIGTEVMIRMGQAIGMRHYSLGFHTTSTLGVFGAAAAVSRLNRLNIDQAGACLAIAASLSSGLRINFGTTVKSMHVGFAASSALRSVGWALGGIRGSSADLFGDRGILATFSGGEVQTWRESIRLGNPFALNRPGFERKRYACCYMLHKIIALGLQIAHHGIRLEQIERLQIEMPRGGSLPLIYPNPTTGMQALFSAQYALLSAISDGSVGFESFTDDAVNRSHIRARLPHVTIIEPVGELGTSEALEASPVTLVAKLFDGSTHTFVESTTPGSAGDRFTTQELQSKWIECLNKGVPRVTPARAVQLFTQGSRLCDDASIEPWLSQLWTLMNQAAPSQSRMA
jgi:2-methylcitrate dehydratase PrpD